MKNKQIEELIGFIKNIEVDKMFLSMHENYGAYFEEIIDILIHYDKIVTVGKRLAKVLTKER